MDKKKIGLIAAIVIALILLIGGITYAYYSATVEENNKTQTIIKTDSLELIFTGVTEITAQDMIPGDSFTKTFTVENTGELNAAFNVYMESITNEFNEDLVFTLSDEDGVIVEETRLPETNSGKSYLASEITIGAKEIKTYTLTITYKYLDTPQNDYQGASFKATLGVDGNKIEAGINVTAKDSNGTDLNATALNITGSKKEKLLTSLEETGYVTNKDEVDALIEVKSDDFDDLATTTFDVSSIASTGDKVVILHFNEETQEWEYIGIEIVNDEGKVTGDFTSYSPVAFVVVKDDGSYENIEKGPIGYYAFGLPTVTSSKNYRTVLTQSGSGTIVRLVEDQLSSCIYKNGTLECFKINNYNEEELHAKSLFGNSSCTMYSKFMNCEDTEFSCSIYFDGTVCCSDLVNMKHTRVYTDGKVVCD